jgi:hypothetical protein
MTENQTWRETISAAGPARLDREFTGHNRHVWLFQVAGKIRISLYRRIPAGFEDETGFHLGVPSGCADERMD